MNDHPVQVEQEAQRGDDWQLRLADRVTTFAGSMTFVWVHVVLFVLWIFALGFAIHVDPFPFNFLTLTVSLEAIFLATFVMIGQNRQADFAARKAAHDYEHQQLVLDEHGQMIRELHARAATAEQVESLRVDIKAAHTEITLIPRQPF